MASAKRKHIIYIRLLHNPQLISHKTLHNPSRMQQDPHESRRTHFPPLRTLTNIPVHEKARFAYMRPDLWST